MPKRTEIKIAVLVQVMDELGFDQDTIAKASGVPRRTVGDIVNRRGCWRSLENYSELREAYRIYLRKHIKDDAEALGLAAFRRLEAFIQKADLMTALRIANAMADLAVRFEG